MVARLAACGPRPCAFRALATQRRAARKNAPAGFLLTSGDNCDTLQHTTNGYRQGGVAMSVRKRTWTTRKGETKEAWIADFTDGTGKRHIRTFQHKKESRRLRGQGAGRRRRGRSRRARP